jgi:hypothetical protein
VAEFAVGAAYDSKITRALKVMGRSVASAHFCSELAPLNSRVPRVSRRMAAERWDGHQMDR